MQPVHVTGIMLQRQHSTWEGRKLVLALPLRSLYTAWEGVWSALIVDRLQAWSHRDRKRPWALELFGLTSTISCKFWGCQRYERWWADCSCGP